MDLKLIEKLMAAMGRSGMKRIVIKEEGMEIELERETPFYAVSTVSLPQQNYAPPSLEGISPSLVESKPSVESGKFIPSPMIGTFYDAPSPDAKPFVKVGDKVEAGSVVCIIEAMKVMNEIKAGVDGVVQEVLVKRGEPVEFGTKLFRIS